MNPVGYIDELTRFYAAGWAADLDDLSSSLSFGVFVNGEGCLKIQAEQLREGLADELGPGASGRYAFRFYFPEPLSPYHQHEVVLRLDGTEFSLRAQLPAIKKSGFLSADDIHRPHRPILLTSLGRSGSTAIMAVLAGHPNILVSGTAPFEVEMGNYYAYAFRTLIAAADHLRSVRPEHLTDPRNNYHIGFNPFLEQSYATSFAGTDSMENFLTTNLPMRLAGAFHDIILDYYQALARAQSKKYPIYFAEKILPEPDARNGVRHMFGDTKEIVLIRDLRDVICSFGTHGHVQFSEALDNAISAARRFLEIKAEADSSILLLRYEDFVLRREDTIESMFRFLSLDLPVLDDTRMTALFANHGTSQTPTHSIGRWRRDLTQEQVQLCDPLSQFLAVFGYET